MGMYTSLKFDAPLSPVGTELVIGFLQDHADRCANAPYDRPDEWAQLAEQLGGLGAYRGLQRHDDLPFTESSFYRDEPDPAPEWDGHRNELVDGTWRVLCSLKNYGGEIEEFLKSVLPRLVSQETEAWSWYEEADVPTRHVVLPHGGPS